MPYTTVVAGTTITASWGNTNVRDQVVTPFATAGARTSAVTAPVQGMLSYRNDLGTGGNLEHYTGTAWIPTGYQLITKTTLAAGAASVTFSSIPGSYSTLALFGYGNLTAAGFMVDCPITINADSGANYSSFSADSANGSLNPLGSFANGQTSWAWAFGFPGTSFGGSQVGVFHITFPGYSGTTLNKAMLNHSNFATDSSTPFNWKTRAGYWKSTNAITSLVLTSGSGNFAAGSHFGLYGLP